MVYHEEYHIGSTLKPCVDCGKETEMVRKTTKALEGRKPKTKKEHLCPSCYDQPPLERWVD